MRNSFKKSLRTLMLSSVLLSGCASMSAPNLDFVKFPEFKEEAENIGGYPNVEDAPQTPTDVRSDAVWDKDAKELIAKRDSFGPIPEGEPTMTDEEFNRKVDELVAKVEEYKADDPQ